MINYQDLGFGIIIVALLGLSEQILSLLKIKKIFYKIVYFVFVASLGLAIYNKTFTFNLY